MGEPLKNKQVYQKTRCKRCKLLINTWWDEDIPTKLIYSCPICHEIEEGKVENFKLHSDEDIKSAVEWLKEEVLSAGYPDSVHREKIDWKDVHKLIDQAFPDLNTDISKGVNKR